MFTMWRDVWYFLGGVLVGALIAVAIYDKPMRELMLCRSVLADPEHCVSYCEAVWQDYFGC